MRSILLLIFYLSFLLARSENDTILVENLRYGWIQISDGDPKPVSDPSLTKLLAFSVIPNDGDLIKVCNDVPIDIWVNLKLIQSNLSPCLYLNLDSLKNSLKSDSLVFEITSEIGLAKLSAEVLQIVESNQSVVLFANRKNQNFRDFYLIGFMFLLLIYGLFRRTAPQRFQRIFLNPFKIRGSSLDDYYTDFLRPDSVFFIVCLAALAAFNLKFLEFSYYTTNFESTSFTEFLLDWVIKTLWIIAFIIGKYVAGSLFAGLFKFKGISNVHNQDFLYLLTWVLLAVFFLSILDFSFASMSHLFESKFPAYLVIFTILVFQIGIYLKLDKILSVNKMLIISYLCATEFLPGFILVYMLLK